MLMVHFRSLLTVLLVASCEQSQSIACNGYCSYDSLQNSRYVSSTKCIDSRRCIERVEFENKQFSTFLDDEDCFRAKYFLFPAYIDKVSAMVRGRTLSTNISWHWSRLEVPDNKDLEVRRGLQYIVSVPGETRPNCHTVLLSTKLMQQGNLDLSCQNFRDDSFSQPKVKIIFLAFVLEKLRYSVKMTPVKLQEVTLRTSEKMANSTVPLWNPRVTYHITNIILVVLFTPAPLLSNYTSYEVRIYAAQKSRCLVSAPYVDKIETDASWPVTSVNFSITKYKECSKYCISVRPVIQLSESSCLQGCVTEFQDILLFYVPPRKQECKYWNATFSPSYDTFKKEIVIGFIVYPEYHFCFENFAAYLFEVDANECAKHGRTIAKETFQRNSSGNVISFANVTPGKYCIVVEPIDAFCRKNYIFCPPRHTNVDRLAEMLTQIPTSSPKDSPVLGRVLIVSALSVLGISIAVTMVGLLWRKSRPVTHAIIDMKDFSRTENSQLLVKRYTNSQIQIVILYTHEEINRRRVRALANFLRDCCRFSVILDEDHMAQIQAESSCFLTEALKYNCARTGSRRDDSVDDPKRIIIVRSIRAENLLGRKLNIMRWFMGRERNTEIAEEEPLGIYKRLDEKIFLPGISYITSNRLDLIDDCHIFVVQFDNFAINERGNFQRTFPGNSYSLSRHLGDLYLNLIQIDHPSDPAERLSRIAELSQLWGNEESYRELTELISVNA